MHSGVMQSVKNVQKASLPYTWPLYSCPKLHFRDTQDDLWAKEMESQACSYILTCVWGNCSNIYSRKIKTTAAVKGEIRVVNRTLAFNRRCSTFAHHCHSCHCAADAVKVVENG